MPFLCCSSVTFSRYALFKTERKDLLCLTLIFLLNVFLTPFLLVWHSLRIYLLPCLYSTCTQCICRISYSWLCRPLCDCFQFKDHDFPPSQSSIGNVKVGGTFDWQRGQCIEVHDPKKDNKYFITKLFDHGYEADDICQGALGDCWLLSAIASLANQPHTLQEAFLSKEFNPRGKYTIKLWDACKGDGKWVRITVDDYIPVHKDSGRPIFVNPRGNEMWVMILEKAFAKFLGSYSAIEGGYSLFAMSAITGDLVNTFTLQGGNWCRLYMKVEPIQPSADPSGKGRNKQVSFYSKPSEKQFSCDEMYDQVKSYYREGFVLAAGSSGKDNTIEEGRGSADGGGGIVPGHAYTILQVYEPMLTTQSDIKLLKIRNPWGTFEWKGDWGDESPMWDSHPQIRLEMGYLGKGANDGVFYISWKDFLQYFDTIDVCFTDRNMGTLHLQVVEECCICGPFVGCLWGCCKYWLCCSGLYHLWCARKSNRVAVLSK